MKKHGMRAFVGIGAISLAIILVVLTIFCFAVLTYVSADSEYKLSQKSQLAVDEYYRADAQANEILQEISLAVQNGKISEYLAKNGYHSQMSNGTYVIDFLVPAGKTKCLRAEAAFSPSGQAEILRWQVTENKGEQTTP